MDERKDWSVAGGGRRLWSAVPTLSAAPTCEDDQSSVVAAPAARVPPPPPVGARRKIQTKIRGGAIKEERHGPTSRSCRGGDAGRPPPGRGGQGRSTAAAKARGATTAGAKTAEPSTGCSSTKVSLQRRGQNDARWDSQRPRITHWRFPEVERVPTGLKMPYQCRRQQCRFNFGLDVRCLARRRLRVGCTERKSETHSTHHAPRRSRMVRKEVESL